VGFSAGVPIGAVGELLGHASAQTTKIYAKLMEDPALRAAESIASRMETLLKPPIG
jgi:site-specific recombinase XerD